MDHTHARRLGKPSHTALALIRAEFEGKAVVFFDWRGRRACLVTDAGKAIGYGRNGQRLVGMLTTNWKDEARVGHHYDIVEGAADLAELRVVLGANTNLVSAKTRHVAILYEAGFHLACTLAGTPVGIRCRAWLTEEVMPQLARTGSYQPEAALPGNTNTAEIQAAVLAAIAPFVERLDERFARVEAKVKHLDDPHAARGVLGPKRANEHVLGPLMRYAGTVAPLLGEGVAKVRLEADKRIRKAVGFPLDLAGSWANFPLNRLGEVTGEIAVLEAQAKRMLKAAGLVQARDHEQLLLTEPDDVPAPTAKPVLTVVPR